LKRYFKLLLSYCERALDPRLSPVGKASSRSGY
jgi:hypothetical protein